MPKKYNLDQLINSHLNTLALLQAPSGLFRAASDQVDTGYDKAWLRDNFYECLPFVLLENWEVVTKTYNALLDIFLKHESKIDHAIAQKPDAKHKYIHARYNPETFSEFWEEWGNKQNDAVGAILFMIGKLEVEHKIHILNSADKVRIVQKLIDYLSSLSYWQDADSGVWEEDEEIHASSVGACLAGLISVAKVPGLVVRDELIKNGQDSLNNLLPRESAKKFVDLAQLSLIFPYNVITDQQANLVLENVEYHLVREMGIIRYKNDYYYNRNPDGYSEEAEWCFGFSWLAIIYTQKGLVDSARKSIQLAFKTINAEGQIPELYFSNSDEHNTNSPLGWAEAMFIIALKLYEQKGYRI